MVALRLLLGALEAGFFPGTCQKIVQWRIEFLIWRSGRIHDLNLVNLPQSIYYFSKLTA